MGDILRFSCCELADFAPVFEASNNYLNDSFIEAQVERRRGRLAKVLPVDIASGVCLGRQLVRLS
jgi:hypothetical protein